MIRRAKTAKLLDLVNWLIEHDDFSGLDCLIENLLLSSHGVGGPRRPWSPASARALFTVIAYYAPDAQLHEMIDTAKDCRRTIEEMEATEAACRLLEPLGVDGGAIEQLVLNRKPAT